MDLSAQMIYKKKLPPIQMAPAFTNRNMGMDISSILFNPKKVYDQFNQVKTLNLNSNYPIINYLQKQHSITVFLPGYLRLKVKNFNSLNLQNLVAEVNVTIIYNIYYGGVLDYLVLTKSISLKEKQKIIKKIQNEFILLFAQDEAIQLTEGKNKKNNKQKKLEEQEKSQTKYLKLKRNLQILVKHNLNQRQFKYTVRRALHLHLESNVFWSPFQQIYPILQVCMQPLEINFGDKKIIIKINLMDTHDSGTKISYGEEKKFAQYGLALSMLQVKYRSQRMSSVDEFYMNKQEISQKQRKKIKQNKLRDIKKVFKYKKYRKYRDQYQKLTDYQKQKRLQSNNNSFFEKEVKQNDKLYLKNYQFGYFSIPIYKFPFTSLASIFLPLWLLAIINLGVFFQDESLSSRIGCIANLMVAFVAFIPSIRQQIPPSSKIIFIEILVYAEAITSFFALIHSIGIRNQNGFKLIWRESVLFIISFILTIVSILIIGALLILHYTIWQPRFLTAHSKGNSFERQRWSNQQCNDNFKNQCLDKQYSINKFKIERDEIQLIDIHSKNKKKETKSLQQKQNKVYFVYELKSSSKQE